MVFSDPSYLNSKKLIEQYIGNLNTDIRSIHNRFSFKALNTKNKNMSLFFYLTVDERKINNVKQNCYFFSPQSLITRFTYGDV